MLREAFGPLFFYIFIIMIRELTWKEFVNQTHIRKLPLNEQVRQFNFHLDQVSNFLHWQNKGKKLRIQITGFLLQEDLFLIQQEDGSGIYITSYA